MKGHKTYHVLRQPGSARELFFWEVDELDLSPSEMEYQSHPVRGKIIYYDQLVALRTCACGLQAFTVKQLEGFVPDKRAKHGYENRCRSCKREYNSKWMKAKRG